MKTPEIKNVKKVKAVLGLVTALFSLAVAIQQIYQLQKGQVAQA